LQKQSKLNESGFAFGLCTDHEKNSAIVFNEYECYELERFWQYILITNKLTECIFHWEFSRWGCDAMPWASDFWNAKRATFLQNTAYHSANDTVSHPRSPESSAILLQDAQFQDTSATATIVWAHY